MKVNYKQSITDRILQAKREAQAICREIENIHITEEELRELHHDFLNRFNNGEYISFEDFKKANHTFLYGILITWDT